MKIKNNIDDKTIELMEFANSVRGRFIISQALTIGADKLKESDPSNSDDMIYLLELYPMYPAVQNALIESKDKLKEAIKNSGRTKNG